MTRGLSDIEPEIIARKRREYRARQADNARLVTRTVSVIRTKWIFLQSRILMWWLFKQAKYQKVIDYTLIGLALVPIAFLLWIMLWLFLAVTP